MTPEEQAAADKAAAEAAAKAAGEAKAKGYRRGQLVGFKFRDEVTGGQLDGIGVVTRGGKLGESIVVRPLTAHDVTVDTAEVEPVVVDEV